MVVCESQKYRTAIGLSYATPDGRFTTPIGDGVVTRGHSIAAVLDKDLNEDWTMNAKIRFARYDHQFILFLDGDAIGPNTPETQAATRAFRRRAPRGSYRRSVKRRR